MTRSGHRATRAMHRGRRRRWAAAAAAAAVAAVAVGGAALVASTSAGPAGDGAGGAQDAAAGSTTPSASRSDGPATSPGPAAGPDARATPRTPRAGRSASPPGGPARAAPPLGASEPDRLVVPALDVDTDVMDLGLTDDGVLEVPQGAFPAGWYTGSPTPGELGPSIIAGHVSWNGEPGVFERLDELDPGDHVLVTRADGRVADYTVSVTRQYAKDAFPTATVYGDIGHAGLRLITCGGLDPASGVFEDNVVVFATLTGTG